MDDHRTAFGDAWDFRNTLKQSLVSDDVSENTIPLRSQKYSSSFSVRLRKTIRSKRNWTNAKSRVLLEFVTLCNIFWIELNTSCTRNSSTRFNSNLNQVLEFISLFFWKINVKSLNNWVPNISNLSFLIFYYHNKDILYRLVTTNFSPALGIFWLLYFLHLWTLRDTVSVIVKSPRKTLVFHITRIQIVYDIKAVCASFQSSLQTIAVGKEYCTPI
jgi:hypothetical protein